MYEFCEEEDDISGFITAGRFRSGESGSLKNLQLGFIVK